MKKGYIVAILVVAAVVVGAAIWAARDNQEDNSNSAGTSSQQTRNASGNSATEPGETSVVEYDGSGFTPETLSVKQGDTVTFVNNSSTLVWPASDDHPTHTNLSGFDALEGLSEGEEYSFTFDETGEWGYHNHLNSSQGGTIIVE